MSVVGPRPERPVFVERFRQTVPGYMLRHKVKAGITGWAQVNGLRGNTSLEKRIQYDLEYIEQWSLWLDLKIIAMTVVRVLVDRNAYMSRSGASSSAPSSPASAFDHPLQTALAALTLHLLWRLRDPAERAAARWPLLRRPCSPSPRRPSCPRSSRAIRRRVSLGQGAPARRRPLRHRRRATRIRGRRSLPLRARARRDRGRGGRPAAGGPVSGRATARRRDRLALPSLRPRPRLLQHLHDARRACSRCCCSRRCRASCRARRRRRFGRALGRDARPGSPPPTSAGRGSGSGPGWLRWPPPSGAGVLLLAAWSRSRCCALPGTRGAAPALPQHGRSGGGDDQGARYMWRSGLAMAREHPCSASAPVASSASTRASRARGDQAAHRPPAQHAASDPGRARAAGPPRVALDLGRLLRRAIASCARADDDGRARARVGSLAAVVGFLVTGLSEYSFGDSEVVMLAWTLMALPLALNASGE